MFKQVPHRAIGIKTILILDRAYMRSHRLAKGRNEGSDWKKVRDVNAYSIKLDLLALGSAGSS